MKDHHRLKNKQHPAHINKKVRIIVYFCFAIICATFISFFVIKTLRGLEYPLPAATDGEEEVDVRPVIPSLPPRRKKIFVPSTTKQNAETIWTAVDNKNTLELENLLKTAKPAHLYRYTNDSRAHLYEHILHNKCIDSFKILLKAQLFDINKHTLLHKTITHFASRSDPIQIQFYEALLTHGADIEYVNQKGLTPLATAIYKQNLAAVNQLIKHDVILNRSFPESDSILHYFMAILDPSCTSGLSSDQKAILIALIRAGANLFHRGKDGCSAFHHALFLVNNIDILRILLNTVPEGFSPERESYKSTLLNYPVSPERVETPSKYSLYGYTPLHLAVFRRDSLVLRFLVKQGADPKLKDNSQMTPYEHAKISKVPDLIAILESVS